MRRHASARHARRRGVVSVWVALLGLFLIGMMGLAIEIGWSMLTAHKLQNAADAAALAGAQKLRSSFEEIRLAAMTIAASNHAGGADVLLYDNPTNDPNGDIAIGNFNRSTRVFTPSRVSVMAVRVVARRDAGSRSGQLPLFFGPVFGIGHANVRRDAIAMMSGGTGAGIICLHETDKWTFRISGDVVLDVNDTTTYSGQGNIQVNSENWDALKFDGTSATLEAAAINVYADEADAPAPQVYDGFTNASMPRIPDPLAGLEPPPVGADLGTVAITGGDHTISPGYYSGGISMTGGALTLEPGIYIVAGEGLNITGGNLLAHEVMFYVLPGDKSDVKLTGNGVIDITPMPLDYPPYGGIAIWQSAENTSAADIQGTDQFDGIDGTLYFPTARVDIAGTSDSFGFSQLIAGSVEVSGSGAIIVNYDGRYPAPGIRVFLVE